MTVMTPDGSVWALEPLGDCDPGERRRTGRLVKTAGHAAEKPDAAATTQAELGSELQGTYRLFDRERVTVDAATGEPAGVSAQEVDTRPIRMVKRVSSGRRKRNATRETDVGGRVIDRVGPAPEGARYWPECDRGADNFDVDGHLTTPQAGRVVRAARPRRQVRDASGAETSPDPWICRAPRLGTCELAVHANKQPPARLEAPAAPLRVPRPRSGVSRYARETGLANQRARPRHPPQMTAGNGLPVEKMWVMMRPSPWAALGSAVGRQADLFLASCRS